MPEINEEGVNRFNPLYNNKITRTNNRFVSLKELLTANFVSSFAAN